jgi:3-deoxy-D-manno-octulosonate 8-phosphate phosphatase (KDO 8-P phosphatase)
MLIGLDDKLPNLKIIVSEVDGVLTDGLLPIDEIGNILYKRFCHKDFEAINILKKHFKVAFISNDNHISYNMFRRKNIPFFYDQKSKKEALIALLGRYSFTPDQALYLGSSYSDMDCMQLIPMSFCPENAIPLVKNISLSVFPVFGGDGVFCYLHYFLSEEIVRREKIK